MIAYIHGTLIELTPTFAVIETGGGLGYHIHISLSTYSSISADTPTGSKIKLFTHLHVKEDAHTLYGFAGEREKNLFVHLISVSGIGPGTARMILSSASPADMEQAILQGDLALLKNIKGIGPKSAQRIVLELQDKFRKTAPPSTGRESRRNSLEQEALAALLTLGFNRSSAEKAIEKLVAKNDIYVSVEQIIKDALKML